MMKKIAVILGHPSLKKGTFCHALAEAYVEGARAVGHKVHMVEIAGLDISCLSHKNDYEAPGIPETIKDIQAQLADADHWVVIYPLWLGMMPAKLKAFWEWVLSPGFAYEYDDKGMPHKLLKGKSARIIVTMGMPGFVYKLFFRAHSLKALKRNIFKFIGVRPVRHKVFGGVEAVSDKKRKAWLATVKAMGEKAA